jgi:hypothetical protein
MLAEMDRGDGSEEENEKKSRKKTKSTSSISAVSTKPVPEARTPSTYEMKARSAKQNPAYFTEENKE